MNVENPWAATQRGPSKYEFEGPRQRPSAAPGKPGTGATRGCHRGHCAASGEPVTARADGLPIGPDVPLR